MASPRIPMPPWQTMMAAELTRSWNSSAGRNRAHPRTPGHEVAAADLGKAVEVEFQDSTLGRFDQLVEPILERADGDEDHKSGPSARTARGKARSFSAQGTMNRSANG